MCFCDKSYHRGLPRHTCTLSRVWLCVSAWRCRIPLGVHRSLRQCLATTDHPFYGVFPQPGLVAGLSSTQRGYRLVPWWEAGLLPRASRQKVSYVWRKRTTAFCMESIWGGRAWRLSSIGKLSEYWLSRLKSRRYSASGSTIGVEADFGVPTLSAGSRWDLSDLTIVPREAEHGPSQNAQALAPSGAAIGGVRPSSASSMP